MTTAVRDFAASDLPVWREHFRAYGLFYETAFTDEVIDRVGALLLAEGSGIDALIAEQNGAIVGFAHIRSHPDTFTGGRDWYLDDLYVTPEVRGTGAGRALIAAITDRAAGSDGTLRWITADTNVTAQALYDKVATRTRWVTYEVNL